MTLRLRLGPITLGRSGPRLSVWRRIGGLSLGRKGGYGLLRAGPLRYHYRTPGVAGGKETTAAAMLWLLGLVVLVVLFLLA